MMAVDDYWQRVVKGLVLLLAVDLTDSYRSGSRNPSRLLFVQTLDRKFVC